MQYPSLVHRGKGGLNKNNYGGQEVLNSPGSRGKKCGIYSHTYYIYKMALNNATKVIRSLKRRLKKIPCNIKNDPTAFYRYARKKMKTKD